MPCLGLNLSTHCGCVCFTATLPEVSRAQARVEEFLGRGILIRRETPWGGVLRRAKSLSRHAAGRFGCRSLDLIHVAMALELGVKVMWSFDDRQRAVAEEAGLEVDR